ncbi:hypothetical protein ACMXYX_17955 (plasmid) [Neptuniibacter sp. QD72_48]|uniref:hypothetical protein n=1 Tax=Neptuniibacter sp. QD72_48 TaxID=3398214 RepID=UPI0039F4EBB9
MEEEKKNVCLEWEIQWIRENVDRYDSPLHAEAVIKNIEKRYLLAEKDKYIAELEADAVKMIEELNDRIDAQEKATEKAVKQYQTLRNSLLVPVDSIQSSGPVDAAEPVEWSDCPACQAEDALQFYEAEHGRCHSGRYATSHEAHYFCNECNQFFKDPEG